MIVLDTNVISELMKPQPDMNVQRWFSGLTGDPVATTAISLAELKAGIALLPEGRRRSGLFEALDAVTGPGSGLPVLAFDADAADTYAALVASRRRAGLHADPTDMMIGAICALADAALATRNVSDFDRTGLAVINPWA